MVLKRLFSFTFISLFFMLFAYSQEIDTLVVQKLRVGTKEVPPFCIKKPDGTWSGISIELWEQIAAELHIEYEYFENDNQTLINQLSHDSLDMIVAALTLTNEREKIIDFSHPFFNTGLGIAVRLKEDSSLIDTIGAILSTQFLKVVASLIFIILFFGFLVWIFERRKNKEQFGGKPATGIGSGFWWAAVTMTTVGYGDKAPRSAIGRLIGFIWMFSGIILISTFTAAITSTLTVSKLEFTIKGPGDLPKVFVGAIQHTTSEKYMKENHLKYMSFSNADQALSALHERRIDALVYDRALLQYLVNNNYAGFLDVLPVTFVRQDYGIALQQGSQLREELNQTLLEKIHQSDWKDILYKYLGSK